MDVIEDDAPNPYYGYQNSPHSPSLEEELEGDDYEVDQSNNLQLPQNSEDELEWQPKKQKLKSLISTYEVAARVKVPNAKPSSGGRDWTEQEAFVVLDGWGGRKSLQSEEWQQVAKMVAKVSKIERTDTQSRNRLDTLKKKYKKEKAKYQDSDGGACKWVYFTRMDELISSPKQHSGERLRDGRAQTKKIKKKRGSRHGSSFRLLADSIHKFSEIYQRIENSKRQHMVELEKMRMDFHKDLETHKF